MQANSSDVFLIRSAHPYNADMRKNSIPRSGVGARLTELRTKAGLSQKRLAEIVDVPIANIGFWERTTTPPSSKILPKLAEALDSTVDYILQGKDTRPRRQTSGPTGRTKEVFEAVSSLPRRQQKKIVDVVDALIAQAKVTK